MLHHNIPPYIILPEGLLEKPTPEDLDIMARTLFGEARGEFHRVDGGMASLMAVAEVIVNRLHHPKKRFGNTIKEVCLKPYQFSCWLKNDPNRQKILTVKKESNALFQTCLHLVHSLVDRPWPAITQGANHYHALWLDKPPAWALHQRPLFKIAQHLFYRLA